MLPMMRPKEQAFLLAQLAAVSDDAHIVEFGCGGSTVLLADHLKPTQHLYSIEHDPIWYARVNGRLSDQSNIHLVLREPTLLNEIHIPNIIGLPPEAHIDPTTLRCEVSMSKWMHEECPAGYAPYLNMAYGNDWGNTKLVLVDGMVRGACLALIRYLIHPDTIILVHDYFYVAEVDRSKQDAARKDWYQWAVRLYQRAPMWDADSFVSLRIAP
jgi:hypothetical protein